MDHHHRDDDHNHHHASSSSSQRQQQPRDDDDSEKYNHHHPAEEEDSNYTDYSCSTNLERLVRDIETTFRQWHVHESDRHFSSIGGNRKNASIPLRNARISWNVRWCFSSVVVVPLTNDHPKKKKKKKNIITKFEYHQQHQHDDHHHHASFELDLTLWDGPPPAEAFMVVGKGGSRRKGSATTWLPFGLRRRRRQQWSRSMCHPPTTTTTEQQSSNQDSPSSDRTTTTTTTDSCMDDFSSLFGIGQYITLTPSATAMNGTNQITSLLLTQWLQTAMNMAAAHSECQFPVFGVWTTKYAPHHPHHPHPYPFMHNPSSSSSSCHPLNWILPAWAMSSLSLLDLHHDQHDDPKFTKEKEDAGGTWGVDAFSQKDACSFPIPLLSGVLVSTEGMSGSFSCSVWPISSIANHQHQQHNKKHPWTWTTWGDVLIRQCYGSDIENRADESNNNKDGGTWMGGDGGGSDGVHLKYAQHTYLWCKLRPQKSFLWEAIGGTYNTHEWRAPTVSTWNQRPPPPPPPPFAPDYYSTTKKTSSSINKHHKNKRHHSAAIDLAQRDDDDDTDTTIIQEYRKQCQRYALRLLEHAAGATSTDPMWGPSEDPVEAMHVILTWTGGSDPDAPLFTLPLRARPTMSQEEYDEMEEATESAILDPHRPNASVVRVFYDHGVAMAAQAATQRCVLAALIRTATLPKETLLPHLVDETMLDQWDGIAGNKIAEVLCKKANVDAATRALVAAMDWTHATEDTIERWQAEDIVKKVLDGTPAHGFPSPPDSIIQTIMEKNINNYNIHNQNDQEDDNTQPRTDVGFRPFAKAAPPGRLLSLLFTHMASVRSPSSIALVWLVFVQELRRRLHCRESLPNMNFVPGLDPPPHTCSNHTNSHFANVGAKANLSGQIYSSEPDPDSCHCLIGQKLQVFNIGIECTVNSEIRTVEQLEKQTQRETGYQLETLQRSPSMPKTLMNGSIIDGIPKVDRAKMNPEESSLSQSHISQEFFDAEEAGSIASSPLSDNPPSLHYQHRRRGARCPVLGASLVSNGDQLYAPYLMRPPPLTDDVVAEQRLVLARQTTGKASTTIRRRLEIIHRFQRPKLQSDMKSFKAANPGASFHDFIGWYGNPDPMLDLGTSDMHEILNANPTDKVMVKKIDKGAEAIRALEYTREFWASTWEQVPATSAEEQELLFDAESTLEMVMDYLENIHPASLLSQVVAVNLAMSYFTLAVSAGEAAKIKSVQATLSRFREKVDAALFLLSRDATYIDHTPDSNGLEMMSSVESIAACTKACEALTEAEVVVARASSLLHKLPRQYKLVESMLKSKEGELVKIRLESERETILNTIHEQQKRLPSAGVIPKLTPAVREYLLQNVDESLPCQLCVRYGDAGLNACGVDKSGILLALRKVNSD